MDQQVTPLTRTATRQRTHSLNTKVEYIIQETFAKQIMEQLQAVELPSGRVWIQLVVFTLKHHVWRAQLAEISRYDLSCAFFGPRGTSGCMV